MTPFRYVEFYDVPRCVIVRVDGQLLMLQSAFDESTDEYPDTYTIYEVPDSIGIAIEVGSWDSLCDTPLRKLGSLLVRDVVFDSTKRETIDASSIIIAIQSGTCGLRPRL